MEKWVKIKQIPRDGYFISDLGRVKIIRNSKEVIKLGSLSVQGYYVLAWAFKKSNLKIHQLVISNFTERPEWAECVNHKNGIKVDNRLDNLEWSTHVLNAEHARRTGLIDNSGANNGRSIPQEVVHEIYRLKKEGKRICEISRIIGRHRRRVQAIYSGKDWKYEYKKFFT